MAIMNNKEEFLTAYRAVVERALKLSEVARREGLLALEESIDVDKARNRDVFEYGLQFVVDGTEPAILNKILSNIIEQEENVYKSHLMVIQKEAVLAIQEGMTVRLLACLLNSYSDLPLSDPIFGLQD